MPSRFEYERAIRASGLPPLSRFLALTLATWADVRTGVIPDRLSPSLSTLEEATGMARSSVRTHLDKLEAVGWLVRKRPSVADARSKKARTRYRITLPKGVAVPDSDWSELGRETPQPRAGDALVEHALGQEAPQSWGSTRPSARAADAPELGRETPSRVPHGPHTSVEYQPASSDEPARIGDRPRIPDASQPLIDAISTAGMAVGWDLQPAEWFLVEALIKRCGIPALVTSARGSWQGARTQPRSGRYFLPAWRALPDAPAATDNQPGLPAAVGQVLPLNAPGHRPSTTDARVAQALEVGHRLQAQADAARTRQEQP